MADIHRWVSTDGNFNAAGSWSTATAPSGWTADDEVWFTAGTQSVTSGFSQTAIEVARFVIEEGYTGDIGTSSTPLIISPLKLLIESAGTNSFYFQGGSATIDRIVVTSRNLVDALVLTGNWTELWVRSGKVTATSVNAVRRLVANGPRAYLDFTAGASGTVSYAEFNGALVNITPASGAFLSAAGGAYGTGIMIVNGGEVVMQGDVFSADATIQNNAVVNGGILRWKSEGTGSIFSSMLNIVNGGTIDYSDTVGGVVNAFTIVGEFGDIIADGSNDWEDNLVVDLRKRQP